MLTKENVFSTLIRIVFIMAFGAFLWASIHHVATYFHSFEANSSDWGSSYALAISIDGTALVLTIGMMFFGKTMPWHAKFIVWAFIIGLTGFSWVVNWEYAKAYQSTALTSHLSPIWQTINPILGSSFAFLNLAYSIVSEFFGTKQKTVEQLQAELENLTGDRALLEKQIKDAKGPGMIAVAKEKALAVKKAAAEVLEKAPAQVHDDELQNPSPASSMQTEPETEMKPVVNTPMPDYADTIAPVMGGIESMMYDLFVANMPALSDVILLSQSVSLVELTAHLQSRFSRHASFITEARVQVVMEKIQQNYPEQFQFAEDETSFETESETEDDGDDVSYADTDVDTGEQESVSLKPRITAKLNANEVKPQRNTDDLTPVSRKSTSSGSKSATSGETEKTKKIRRLVKQNPGITPVEIATKLKIQGLNVSSQYAGRIKKQVLAEAIA